MNYAMNYTNRILKLNRYDKDNELNSEEYYNSILTDDALKALDKRIKDDDRLGWNNSLERYCKHKIENKLSNGEYVDILKYTNNISHRKDYNTNLYGIMWEYLNSLPVLAKSEYCSIRAVIEGEENMLLVSYLDIWEFTTVENGEFTAGPYNDTYNLTDFYTPPHGRELMDRVNMLYGFYEERSAITEGYETLEEIVDLVEEFIKEEKARNRIEVDKLIDRLTN